MIQAVEIFIGFASGLSVGAGFVAFLTVLGLIPRLIQLSKTDRYVKPYESGVVLGAMFGTFLSIDDYALSLPLVITILWGLLHGIFIGMLAAGLAEALNVFPILAKRIGMESHLAWLLMALVFGKVFGALFQWLLFTR